MVDGTTKCPGIRSSRDILGQSTITNTLCVLWPEAQRKCTRTRRIVLYLPQPPGDSLVLSMGISCPDSGYMVVQSRQKRTVPDGKAVHPKNTDHTLDVEVAMEEG